MDILKWLQEHPVIITAIGAVLLMLFKNNPVIAKIIQMILDAFTPKSVTMVSPSDAVKHHLALAEALKDCPEAKKPLDDLWTQIPKAK